MVGFVWGSRKRYILYEEQVCGKLCMWDINAAGFLKGREVYVVNVV